MIAPYVDSHIVCGFVLSWQDTPPQHCEHSIWDCVGINTMPTFLNSLVESQFDSFLKLIIPFWYHTLYYYYSSSSSLISCHLVAVRSCHCVLSIGWFEGLLQHARVVEIYQIQNTCMKHLMQNANKDVFS